MTPALVILSHQQPLPALHSFPAQGRQKESEREGKKKSMECKDTCRYRRMKLNLRRRSEIKKAHSD